MTESEKKIQASAFGDGWQAGFEFGIAQGKKSAKLDEEELRRLRFENANLRSDLRSLLNGEKLDHSSP